MATKLSFDVNDLFGRVRDKIFGENSWNHEDVFVKKYTKLVKIKILIWIKRSY
jgi:hypothetical protein